MVDYKGCIAVRPMRESDRADVLSMMRTFYVSPAVLSNGSEEIFTRDFNACVGDCPFLEGYILTADDETAGYAMLAMGFTCEYGALCVWIEDIYVKEAFRGRGLAPKLLDEVRQKYPGAVLRLEVEDENAHALHVYKKRGFAPLSYVQMISLPRSV